MSKHEKGKLNSTKDCLFDPEKDEALTVLVKAAGEVYIYGRDEEIVEVVKRMREKGYRLIIKNMHPCV